MLPIIIILAMLHKNILHIYLTIHTLIYSIYNNNNAINQNTNNN